MWKISVWSRWDAWIVKQILHLLQTEERCCEDKYQRIAYSIQMIWNETEKILLLSILFLVTHHYLEFVIAFSTITSVRIFVGGSHRTTSFGCFLQSLLTFALILYGSELVHIPDCGRVGIDLVLIICIWRLAPLPTVYHICSGREQRLAMKCKALTALVLIGSVMYLVNAYIGNIMEWALLVLILDIGLAQIALIGRKEGDKSAEERLETKAQ